VRNTDLHGHSTILLAGNTTSCLTWFAFTYDWDDTNTTMTLDRPPVFGVKGYSVLVCKVLFQERSSEPALGPRFGSTNLEAFLDE
jgi:hypothetical protein